MRETSLRIGTSLLGHIALTVLTEHVAAGHRQVRLVVDTGRLHGRLLRTVTNL